MARKKPQSDYLKLDLRPQTGVDLKKYVVVMARHGGMSATQFIQNTIEADLNKQKDEYQRILDGIEKGNLKLLTPLHRTRIETQLNQLEQRLQNEGKSKKEVTQKLKQERIRLMQEHYGIATEETK